MQFRREASSLVRTCREMIEHPGRLDEIACQEDLALWAAFLRIKGALKRKDQSGLKKAAWAAGDRRSWGGQDRRGWPKHPGCKGHKYGD